MPVSRRSARTPLATRRAFARLLGTGVALLLLAIVAAPAARAAETPTHQLLFTLEGKVENGIPLPPPEAELEDACGVALDPAGDLYVSDYYHHVIDVYGPAQIGEGSGQPGGYLTQIADPEPSGPCNLAIGPAGEVFANQWRGRVLEFKPSEFPPTEETTYSAPVAIDSAHTSRATGIATDAAGNLYVDEGSYVALYEAPVAPGSEPAKQIGAGTLGTGEGSGYGLALSSYPATAGYLYVADAATKTVKVYDPATEPLAPFAAMDGAGIPGGGFTSLLDSALAVDPTDGHVFVAENTQPGEERPAAAVDEFNSAGAYRGRLPGSFVDAEPTALAIDGKGDVYATSGNTEGAVVDVFGPTEPAHALKIEKAGGGGGVVSSEPAGIRCGTACAAEYNAGTEVVLTAIPDARSSFGSWSGCLRSSGLRCTVQMTADRTPSVTFNAIPQQTLTLTKSGSGVGAVTSAPAGIECAAACTGQEAEFNEGSEVTLSAAAPLGSRFAGFSGSGCSGTGPCTVTMSAARTVDAEFEAVPTQSLSVAVTGAGTVSSEPAGIECGEACAAQFNEGTEVALRAVAAPGWRFAGFSGGCSGTGACTVTLDAQTTVSAEFVPIQHTLSLIASGSGSGTVSSEPAGIECGEACAAQFDEGTAVNLTAVAAPGSRFVGWAGAGCSGNRACHLTLAADTQVSASFVLVRPTLAVSRAGAGQGMVSSELPGTIECGAICAAVLNRGATITLIATPLPGSAFAGWGGCDSVAGESCTVRMGDDRTVTASFEAAAPARLTCRKGFVLRHGKCTKKPKRRHRHRHRGGRR